ncbi:MAG: hypothetical protein IJN69_02310 [Oscillospiraceae bacterium]|nr:hypothetical protein [Oscillospiraceae bacterium]
MKLKVLKEFFDRKEDKYVYPSKTPTIEREGVRAAELISAGVAEEYVGYLSKKALQQKTA